jgi:hypothetical protein
MFNQTNATCTNTASTYSNPINMSVSSNSFQTPSSNTHTTFVNQSTPTTNIHNPVIAASASNIPIFTPLSNAGWNSGMSPHRYELVKLPNNVKNCYGCGAPFADIYRATPRNTVIKHVDRRIMRRDPLTGQLHYSPDYYYGQISESFTLTITDDDLFRKEGHGNV